MSFANHGLSADILARAKDLLEGKTKDEEFVIPEDINKEDVGDFVVAAAAAKKAGKKEFEFGGKKFPVTIKTDIKTEEKDEDDDTEGKVKNDIEVDPELEEAVVIDYDGGIDTTDPDFRKLVKKLRGKFKVTGIDPNGYDEVKFTFPDDAAVQKFIKVSGIDILHEAVNEASDKEVKMAIGIASDKRYAGGNYTGAVKAIEKIKKGLSKHKQVAAVLKRQNEETLSEARWEFKASNYKVGGNLSYDDQLDYKLSKSDADLLTKFMKQAKNDKERSKVWNIFWDSKETGDKAKGPEMAIAYAKKAMKEETLDETGVAGGQYSPIKKFDSPKHEDDVEVIDNLPEGAMKKFHQMMDDGASAADIAKELKIDVKVVKKLMKEDKQFHPDHFLAIKEVFEDFMVEGTMAHGIFSRDKAQAQAAMDALQDLMRKKLPVGRDGSSSAVEDKVYDIVFDDQLFDDFDELRNEKGDNADARPLIRARLKQLRVKV